MKRGPAGTPGPLYRDLGDRWATVAFVQAQTNPFQRLESRQLLGAGLRRDLVKDKRGTVALGPTPMLELERLEGQDGHTARGRLSVFLHAARQLGAVTRLDAVLFWQPLFAAFGSARTVGNLARFPCAFRGFRPYCVPAWFILSQGIAVRILPMFYPTRTIMAGQFKPTRTQERPLSPIGLDRLKPAELPYEISEPGGLRIVVGKHTKTFVFRFKSPSTGKSRKLTIGRYPKTSLSMAR